MPLMFLILDVMGTTHIFKPLYRLLFIHNYKNIFLSIFFSARHYCIICKHRGLRFPTISLDIMLCLLKSPCNSYLITI